MANILNYLEEETRPISPSAPFTEVDNLILSWFASMPIAQTDAGTMGAAAREMQPFVAPGSDAEQYLRRLADSARFSDLRFENYESERNLELEMQFAAVTLFPGDDTMFVAFRGTDASLVGWKEDLNMAAESETPGQRRAVEYLAAAAGRCGLPIRVGGHSKGGNLAVYASILSPREIQSRILEVFCNDGPGLSLQAFESEGFLYMRDRLTVFLPHSSMVGILLYRMPECRIVKSDALGPMQHFPCSWQVEGGRFVEMDRLSLASLYADRVIKKWMTSVTLEERRQFIDELYRIVTASGVSTFSELFENWRKNGAAILSAFKSSDPDMRRFIRHVFALLLVAGAKSVHTRRRAHVPTDPASSLSSGGRTEAQ